MSHAVIWIAFFLSLPMGVQAQPSKSSATVKKSATKSTKKVKAKSPPMTAEEKAFKERLLLAAKLFRQGDAVAREMWFVVSEDRMASQRTVFGKLNRAVQNAAGIKLPKNVNFRCDQYDVKFKTKAVTGPLEAEVFENCIVRNPKIISEWTMKDTSMEVRFYTENLADVLGLGSSVMSKKMTCSLDFAPSGMLKSMECESWTQDRTPQQIVDLKKFKYQADKEALMEIEGHIVEDMIPAKKIETKVPLKGPIVVTETEIPPPVSPAKEKGQDVIGGPDHGDANQPVPQAPVLQPPTRPGRQIPQVLPDPEYIEMNEGDKEPDPSVDNDYSR